MTLKKLSLTLDNFCGERPHAEGQYLWKPDSEADVRLIHVFYKEGTYHGGVHFEGYWAVANMGMRNVAFLKGKFLKLEFDE
ncbi:hypothetical protein GR11A_00189 [Vibrio phage vB_VcorM_GR11A]|nr:hypothetical protein GR11A_00189 [Vibrio phage vB_VcorM_GR11A]